METASVIVEGRRQIARLPKSIHLPATVVVRQEGDAVVLEPARMMAWQHHFAAIFDLEALGRVRGFSPAEMALPNHPDTAYEFAKTLKDCGYILHSTSCISWCTLPVDLACGDRGR